MPLICNADHAQEMRGTTIEIVERLRDMSAKKYRKDWAYWVQEQCTVAADEIEKLRKENDVLMNKLRAKMINEKQQPAVQNDGPAVWDLVMQDMHDRDKMGTRKHEKRLQPNNGRDALVDAYQEALDLVVYLRQEIYERDEARVNNDRTTIEEIDRLRRYADTMNGKPGTERHRFRGHCPDNSQPDSRDPECEACRLLR